MPLFRLYKKVSTRDHKDKASTTKDEATLATQLSQDIQEMPKVKPPIDSNQIATHPELDVGQTSALATQPESIAEHPIQRCDQDILSTIFEWFACDYMTYRNHRAAQLLQVCRRWRQVALQTPQLWSYFDIGLNRPMSSNRRQWDWLMSMRPAGPGDIHVDCTGSEHLDQSGLIGLWSYCRISSLERINLLDFSLVKSSTAAAIANCSIPLLNTRIDQLFIESRNHTKNDGMQVPWEVDKLLETFPYVRDLKFYRLSHFSFRSRNVFFHTTFLYINECVDASIIPGLSSFVNLERFLIIGTKIPEGSEIPTTITVRMPSLRWLCIYQVPWFPWAQLECPSLQVISGEELVSDGMIQFFKNHPHLRDIDVQVEKHMFASFARAIPHVETLDLRGYIEGLVDWQTTTDLVEPPFPNMKRLVLDNTDDDIELGLFESIVKVYCLPSVPFAQSNPTGEFNPRIRLLECLGVLGKVGSFSTANWAQSSLLTGSIWNPRTYSHLDPCVCSRKYMCLEFRWPESNHAL